ncbi:helix-turn-helix domain-containing protein [Thiocapsa sp. N5-Cardenillas]|uniref:helix-turn-helix domain-containing protein n=1 Tax=Thiocapsa sp. N5-Cardenillas TaxID=3137397 RepID=UPI0035B1355F
MAYGSFAPVYTTVKRQLLANNDKAALIVLDVLAQHADVYGWAFPGLRRMADLCHYRPETVQANLEKLKELGYIKIYETWNPRRHQVEYDYQLSPDVMWIRDEFLEHAWAKWTDSNYILPAPDSVENRQNVINVAINVAQPATEPDLLKPELYPDTESAKNPPPPPNSALQKGLSANHAGTPGDGWTKQPQGKKQPTGTNSRQANNSRKAETDQETPPVPANPPRVDGFKEPLPEVHAETLAHKIRDELGTRLTQARQIVSDYGFDRTAAALGYVRQEQRANRPIKSPVGLMRWWLQNDAITPTEAADAGAALEHQERTTKPWLYENEGRDDHTESEV